MYLKGKNIKDLEILGIDTVDGEFIWSMVGHVEGWFS